MNIKKLLDPESNEQPPAKETFFMSTEELRSMDDNAIIDLAARYPYESQWDNQEAFSIALHLISLRMGRRYMQTGNINSFKKIPR